METIRRSPFSDDWEYFARMHKIDNEFWREEDKWQESSDEPFQQIYGISPRHPNKKRVVVQEEGNRVREIPSENNGEIVEKRYSTEPSWLDSYRIENSDEDSEADLAEMESRLQALRS